MCWPFFDLSQNIRNNFSIKSSHSFFIDFGVDVGSIFCKCLLMLAPFRHHFSYISGWGGATGPLQGGREASCTLSAAPNAFLTYLHEGRADPHDLSKFLPHHFGGPREDTALRASVNCTAARRRSAGEGGQNCHFLMAVV